MPIYEYHCATCQGRYKHLAKRFDAPPPACPRCGNMEVERLVSAVSVLRSASQHDTHFNVAASRVDADDLPAVARLLQTSGQLEDAEGVYGSSAYRELLRRRSAGATDHDLSDLVGDLVAEVEQDSAVQATAARKLGALQVLAQGAAAAHPHDHGFEHQHEHGPCEQCPTPKQVDNLGWA